VLSVLTSSPSLCSDDAMADTVAARQPRPGAAAVHAAM
jgi:hypothetical protein